MVIGSSMSNFLKAPWRIVILPAASSILVTWPSTRADCARPRCGPVAPQSAIKLIRTNASLRISPSSFHCSIRVASLHGHGSEHPVFPMAREQTCEFEGPAPGELPEEFAGFSGREADPIGIGMLHIRVLTHRDRVPQISGCGGDNDSVGMLALVADDKANLLAPPHLDFVGLVDLPPVLLAHRNRDRARRLFRVTGLAGRKCAVIFVRVGRTDDGRASHGDSDANTDNCCVDGVTVGRC